MRPAQRLCAAAGFPGFWKRSLDEFKRVSTFALKLEALEGPKNNIDLWSFNNLESVEQCVDLSDEDIGGFSKAIIEHIPATNAEPAHLHFHGNISNRLPPAKGNEVERTGYAAWRTRERPRTIFGKPLWDVDRHTYLALRVKSDGRKYKVNIQTESVEYTDLHQHRLYSRKPGQWETVLIRWDDFVRTNHGIIVEPQSSMMKEKVRTIGIGLTDRQPGPFEFSISKIWATNALSLQDLEDPDSLKAKPALKGDGAGVASSVASKSQVEQNIRETTA